MASTEKFIVFSAPSGSGKTTLVKHLLSREELPLEFSVSVTSRKPRHNEKDGKDYYFVNPDTFKSYIDADLLVEYEEVYPDMFYGTLKREVERIWNLGKAVLFDVDVVGGLNIKCKYPSQTLAIFVAPPNIEELERRLIARGTEAPDKIRLRIDKANQEMALSDKFDVTIENHELEKAKEKAYRLVSAFLKD